MCFFALFFASPFGSIDVVRRRFETTRLPGVCETTAGLLEGLRQVIERDIKTGFPQVDCGFDGSVLLQLQRLPNRMAQLASLSLANDCVLYVINADQSQLNAISDGHEFKELVCRLHQQAHCYLVLLVSAHCYEDLYFSDSSGLFSWCEENQRVLLLVLPVSWGAVELVEQTVGRDCVNGRSCIVFVDVAAPAKEKQVIMSRVLKCGYRFCTSQALRCFSFGSRLPLRHSPHFWQESLSTVQEEKGGEFDCVKW